MKKFISLAIILFGISIVFSSCQKEDEVEIDPGNLAVINNSESTFSIFIKNVDKESSEMMAGKVVAFGNVDIPLELGYTYEVIAIEDNPQGEPNTYNRTVLVQPHVEMTWSLPNKMIRN